MGRPANPQAKTLLLQHATQYVLAHGLTHLSLRPLASALGVSPRLLLYHFGSKEQLVVEVLSEIANQQQAVLGYLEASTNPHTRFDRLWQQLTSPQLTPFLRTLFEVELRAMEGDAQYQQFAQGTIQIWIGLVASHLNAVPTPVANFVLAALTGLLIDRFSTHDTQRSDQAFAALKQTLISGGLL